MLRDDCVHQKTAALLHSAVDLIQILSSRHVLENGTTEDSIISLQTNFRNVLDRKCSPKRWVRGRRLHVSLIDRDLYVEVSHHCFGEGAISATPIHNALRGNQPIFHQD